MSPPESRRFRISHFRPRPRGGRARAAPTSARILLPDHLRPVRCDSSRLPAFRHRVHHFHQRAIKFQRIRSECSLLTIPRRPTDADADFLANGVVAAHWLLRCDFDQPLERCCRHKRSLVRWRRHRDARAGQQSTAACRLYASDRYLPRVHRGNALLVGHGRDLLGRSRVVDLRGRAGGGTRRDERRLFAAGAAVHGAGGSLRIHRNARPACPYRSSN